MTQPTELSRARARIKRLPERVINKIAAGEVVERPSAVVKELVENSLDAGATRIEITIEKSGTRLISIVDNGWGIPPDQIEIAFSRHATSKIAGYADLDRIASYGFRGEALPSIASVSRFCMVSRTPENDAGVEIVFEGGVLQSVKPIAAPVGTRVEVENLFFNTPARRKFLKAEATEARHISRVVQALALGKPSIGFAYTLNGRSIMTQPSGQNLRERTTGLLASGRELVAIEGEAGPAQLSGFVGPPDTAQNNRWGHFIFINDRYIHSATLSHAVAAGYGELLPKGLFPIGAILLTVDPSEVDVNVHPAKTEVRLSREREIHDGIARTVKNALRQDGIIPLFQPKQAAQSFPFYPGGISRQGSGGVSHVISGFGNQQPLKQEFLKELYNPSTDFRKPETRVSEHINTETGEIHEVTSPAEARKDSPYSGGSSISGVRLVGRFSDLYLILQAGDDLYIVDQHTAHERVLYEDTYRRLESQALVGQHLLLPVQVELSLEQMAIFDEAAGILNQSGFVLSEFGGRMINIEAVPSILSRKAPERIIRGLIDDIASLKKEGHDLKKALAQSMACRAAVMAGDRLGDQEAVSLLSQLLQCENRYSCPHGRPTFVKIRREELDKQFGRG